MSSAASAATIGATGPTVRPRALGPLQSAVVLLGLVFLTIFAFEPVRHNGFVRLDDRKYITENPDVQGGLTGTAMAWAFTTRHAGNWHPLTWISHMVDVQLFGLSPRGHHLVSLLVHLFSALLLFLTLKALTGEVWWVAAVAALFAVHPLHVESVAWAAERKDVLSGLFFTLTLAGYARYVRRPGAGRYAAVLAMFILGLLSKSMLVTVPFVLLLLDYWPLGRLGPADGRDAAGRRRLAPAIVLEKLPFFLAAATVAAVTYRVQQASGWVRSAEHYPFPVRLSNAAVSTVAYVRKTVWPFDLAIPYPHRGAGLGAAEIWLSVGLILAAVALTLRLCRRAPYLMTGVLWFLGMLVPVIGLVQIADQGMADRYTYLSHTGLFIAAALAVKQVAARRPALRAAAATLSLGALVLLASLTRAQVGYWRDDVTLFRHALEVTSDNWLAIDNLAVSLMERGEYGEAWATYERLPQAGLSSEIVRNNIGALLLRQGKLEEAAASFRRAIELNPNYAKAWSNLGSLLARQERYPQAIDAFRSAIRLGGESALLFQQLGVALILTGRDGEAVTALESALRLDPRDATTHRWLGKLLGEMGRTPEAQAHLREADRLERVTAGSGR